MCLRSGCLSGVREFKFSCSDTFGKPGGMTKLEREMHNTAATGDKGRVPVSVEVIEAGSSPLVENAHASVWILRRAESFSGTVPI